MKERGRGALSGLFHWVPWLGRAAAITNLMAVMTLVYFMVRSEYGPIGVRMRSILANEAVFHWSWGVKILSAVMMTGVFLVLVWMLEAQYRSILQMALMIWIIGAAGWILQDLMQMWVMPTLSRMFLAVPTAGLADYILMWERLLFRLGGVFSCTCYAISGLIYTAIMFRSDHIPSGMARYSFVVWCFVLLTAVSVRWLEGMMPWLTAFALLMLVPWFWRLGQWLPRPAPS
ncbi:hypothetical protein [Salinithrix halophila]|uniref:Uncharacterized protein n=1 Tax=Salinithrix halophila TaxID=1485204 RepID=A0ABV8JH10_9BACL